MHLDDHLLHSRAGRGAVASSTFERGEHKVRKSAEKVRIGAEKVRGLGAEKVRGLGVEKVRISPQKIFPHLVKVEHCVL